MYFGHNGKVAKQLYVVRTANKLAEQFAQVNTDLT